MPLYDYECRSCGHRVEVMHGVNGTGPTACERCGGPMRKLISTPSIVFKGSGWAKKDARDARPSARSSTSGADKSDGGSSEKSQGGSSEKSGSGSPEGSDSGSSEKSDGGSSETSQGRKSTTSKADESTTGSPKGTADRAKTVD